MKNKFYSYIQNLQNQITSKLEEVDGAAKFREDIWERPEGGGGRTRVIDIGNVFEKLGGDNVFYLSLLPLGVLLITFIFINRWTKHG